MAADMTYDRRQASQPPPLFDVGDQVDLMSGDQVVFTGKIFSRVGYDDFVGCWRYKVKDARGGAARTFNETSLRATQAAGRSDPDLGHLAPDRLAEGLRKRLEQELNKLVRGAGKVTQVQTDGPGTGWLVVFDTEYAALKAYYHYRRSEPNFGKAQGGGWYISTSK